MFGNWVKETTATIGAGTLALSAVANFPRFAEVFKDGQTVQYAILDSQGNPVEAGLGRYVSANQLNRDYPQVKYVGGALVAPAGTAVNLGTDNTNTPWTVIATPVAQGIVPTLPGMLSSPGGPKMITPRGYDEPFSNTKTLTANTPVVLAGRFDIAREITAIGVLINTAAGIASDRIQVGLYPVKPDGSAGSLFCRSGDIAPNTTGLKSASVVGGNILVPSGWYYIAIASNVAPTLAAFNAGGNVMTEPTPLGWASSGKPITDATTAALSAGWTALPNALPAFNGFNDISTESAPTPFLVSS